MRAWLCFLLFFCSTIIQAGSSSSVWFDQEASGKLRLHVDLFVSSTCPHCHKADAFFKTIEKKNSWLLVHRYLINQDKSALETFYHRLQQHGSTNFAVPAVFFCGSQWTGFEDEGTTGRLLTDALAYCYQQITHEGLLSPATIHVLQRWGGATLIQIDPKIAKSDLKVVVFSALSDAFLTCSLFCFVAFLAFLWLFPTQRWYQFGVGVVFLSSLLATHVVQQVYSDFYYQITFKLTWVAVLMGFFLLFLIGKDYRKMRPQREIRPTWVTYAAIIFTAFIVQTYQQTCPLNFALVFEQWLTGQNLSWIRRSLYQLTYQMIYFLPLIVLMLFYLFLGRHRCLTFSNKILAVAARLILASIGIILLVYPLLMASLWASILVLLGSVVLGWLLARRYEQDY